MKSSSVILKATMTSKPFKLHFVTAIEVHMRLLQSCGALALLPEVSHLLQPKQRETGRDRERKRERKKERNDYKH